MKPQVTSPFASVVEMDRVYEACTRILGRRPTALTPDAISETVEQVAWNAFPDWESKSDAHVAIATGLYSTAFAGPLLVVTEASFGSNGGAFMIEARELGHLVEQHLPRHGECFFNGDVIVVECEGSRVWLFHHEGHHVTLSGSSGEE